MTVVSPCSDGVRRLPATGAVEAPKAVMPMAEATTMRAQTVVAPTAAEGRVNTEAGYPEGARATAS